MLPLNPRSKTPMTHRGLLQATIDPNQVEYWWAKEPEANIGIRTGIAFDVLDIDGPEGLATLASIAPGYKHPGPVAATGKGYHMLFEVTGKSNFANPREGRANGAASPFPGLDFRGRSGYIVAAPSVHPDGHEYHWVRSALTELPAAPQWLLDLFPKPIERRAPQATAALTQSAAASLDLPTEFAQIGVVLVPAGGGRLRGACPFHKDDTPSLVVYPGDRGFFCYGCGAWGDALNVRRFAVTGALR